MDGESEDGQEAVVAQHRAEKRPSLRSDPRESKSDDRRDDKILKTDMHGEANRQELAESSYQHASDDEDGKRRIQAMAARTGRSIPEIVEHGTGRGTVQRSRIQ